MLILGTPKRDVYWADAGIWLTLIPLPDDVKQRFIQETLVEVRNEKDQLIDMRRDTAEYAKKVGNYCIKAWRGDIVNEQGNVCPCRPDAIDQFMMNGPAQRFVFGQVEGLDLYLKKELNEGKPDSESSSNGSQGEDQNQHQAS